MFLLLVLLFCELEASHWPVLLEDVEHMTPVAKGASNHNYLYTIDSSSYFVRFAPEKQALYADLAIEAKVLEFLGPLDVSAQLIYHDAQKNALVTTFIEHEDAEVDLLDPRARKEVIKLLHKIEKSSCTVERVFEPYRDITSLLEKSLYALPEEFYSYLPLLQRIDHVLAKDSYKTLCHLDLHHKNILKNQDRYWIIDWEYSAMSHPFFVLASMASIERWDDFQMRELLNDYMDFPTEADFERLYLYRIVADLFWTVWCHVQMCTSPLDAPYENWRNLFYVAAKERMQQLTTLEVLLLFGPPGSGKGTQDTSDNRRYVEPRK
ncbi:MAG: phosphotransferase [Chlamydiota bacterium]